MASDFAIACLIRAMGVQAEIEGMKALNKQLEMGGHSPAHGDDHFYHCQNKLDELAKDVLRNAQ